MRAAYLSCDDTNTALAQELAAAHGIAVQSFFPRDVLPTNIDVLIVDADFLLSDPRRVVDELLRLPTQLPRAVHSYNLDDEQVAVLRSHGVQVHRCLSADLFVELLGDTQAA